MKIKNKNQYIPKPNFYKKRNLVRGYSIVEILIYLSIFTALSILVINSFIVILSSFNTTNINRKLLESATVSMERISREIRQAENVDPSTTSTSLVLITSYAPTSSTTVKFIGENGLLNMYKGNNLVPEGNLLDQNVSLTSLVFRRITTTESEAIKIEMTLEYNKGNSVKSENFYNTIILRGGY